MEISPMSKVKRKPPRSKRKIQGVVAYTVPQVSGLLGVSENTVRDMLGRGELEYERAGRLIRILAGPFHAKYGTAVSAEAAA
jgi:excisionase family DNA binding protein